MKLTDGLFHQVFDHIASEYKDIESEHMIIDIGTARLAKAPDRFDVVVLPNLYGDIVSDVVAELSGSIGLAGSANIGERCAMFEAVHGSAPDIAGQDLANPSGLLHAAILMLDHLGQFDEARRLHNAWLRTVEDRLLTPDVCPPQHPEGRVGTREFTRAVAERMGKEPRWSPPAAHHGSKGRLPTSEALRLPRPVKTLHGVDVFLDWDEADRDPNVLGAKLEALAGPELTLRMITNRGTKVYPEGLPETFCTDHWRCRFVAADPQTPIRHGAVLRLLERLDGEGLDFVKTEHLYAFDGERGYSLGQGE
jgi:isocitrate dehydrogenase